MSPDPAARNGAAARMQQQAQQGDVCRRIDSAPSTLQSQSSFASSQGSSITSRATRMSSARYHKLPTLGAGTVVDPRCLQTVARLGEGGFAVVEKAL
jgi:hypothetical protein